MFLLTAINSIYHTYEYKVNPKLKIYLCPDISRVPRFYTGACACGYYYAVLK